MTLPQALIDEDRRLRALAVECRKRWNARGFDWEWVDYGVETTGYKEPQWLLAELRSGYTLGEGEYEVEGVELEGAWSFKEYAKAVGVSTKEVKQSAMAYYRWLHPKTFKCGCECYCRSPYQKTVERALLGEASY